MLGLETFVLENLCKYPKVLKYPQVLNIPSIKHFGLKDAQPESHDIILHFA